MEEKPAELLTIRAKVLGRPRLADYKRIWDNYEIIGHVQKSTKIKFVIAAAIRDGVKYINIREFYNRAGDKSWRPGSDGITIPIYILINNGENMIFPFNEFKFYIDKAAEHLETMPLSDPDKAVIYRKDTPYRLQYTDLDGNKFNMEVTDED